MVCLGPAPYPRCGRLQTVQGMQEGKLHLCCRHAAAVLTHWPVSEQGWLPAHCGSTCAGRCTCRSATSSSSPPTRAGRRASRASCSRKRTSSDARAVRAASPLPASVLYGESGTQGGPHGGRAPPVFAGRPPCHHGRVNTCRRKQAHAIKSPVLQHVLCAPVHYTINNQRPACLTPLQGLQCTRLCPCLQHNTAPCNPARRAQVLSAHAQCAQRIYRGTIRS
jgi:hypothetical protein